MKPKSNSKQAFENRVNELKYLGIKITPEFKFCETRKFRADFMVEYKDKKCLLEYEGIFNVSKSRHTTGGGFSNDCEKYNIASILGYPILRYTAKTYRNVTNDVINILGR